MERYQSGEKEKPSFFQRLGLKKSNKQDTHLDSGKTTNKRNKTKHNAKTEKAFENISKELPQFVIGQEEYLEALTIAFKRAFVVDNQKSYKNLIIILGPDGSGRKYSVKVLAKLLSIEKMIKNSSIYTLDFSDYTEAASLEKLFYQDIYRAFYSDASIVVFDKFDIACNEIIRAIDSLGINGELKTDKRFGWSRGQFQEATGSYSQGVSDHISANDKFIVLVSNKKRGFIENLFSNAFMSEIYDIIETNNLSDDIFAEITNELIEQMYAKIECSMNIEIERDSIVEGIIKVCNKKKGIHSIEEFLENKIYNPLVELCLQKDILPNCKVHILFDNDMKALYANEYMLSLIDRMDNLEALDTIKKQLENIIGLESVKTYIAKLENNIRFQRMHNKNNESFSAMHMIFMGNPGTGKTTVARIVAQYLKALGVLSEGKLIEVTRGDLVGQYVGETAQKTSKKIKEAMGGVLFIDEAYSLCLGKNDWFGQEAINTLVKYMEDFREDLVVIVAGYNKEMQQFLDSNSGLRSRFNHVIEFPDYSPDELLQITSMMVHQNSYTIDEKCNEYLLDYYTKKQIPGRKDVGNGRMVRNIVEKAITNYSNRYLESKNTDCNSMKVLTMEDFGFDESSFDLESELNNIIGLNEIKNFIRNLNSQLSVDKKRREAGYEVNIKQSLNMLFLGNPGTGKTYVARILAKLLKETGYLASDVFVETDRSGLVAEFTGQTAQKTKDIFESALGGVLFIDEAYSLSPSNPFDKEAIDILVKLIEDHAGNIVVILAGYKKEMTAFLNSNSGLKSRFGISMEFADYSIEELTEILKKQATDRGFIIDEAADIEIKSTLQSKSRVNELNGNGRMARNILEEAIRNQTVRLSNIGKYENPDDLITLIKEDFKNRVENKNFNLEEKFANIVGLEYVKEYIKSLYNMLRVEKARQQMGIEVEQSQTLHMIFKGNPGTGKTTMARIVGDILYELGILSSNNIVETDRAGLVAGYVGQTALKTKEVIGEAMNGVLFIDEAYTLSDAGTQSDFGKEAIDTLVKDMDDNRDRLVVILAGYSDEMDKFLTTNPGLASRFPNIIEFPDYTVDELLIITEQMLKVKKYCLSENCYSKLRLLYEKAKKDPHFGNGRYVRNVCERAIRNMSSRVAELDSFSLETLTTITVDDILEG